MDANSKPSSKWQRWYKVAAYLTLNTLLVLLVLNIALGVYYHFHDEAERGNGEQSMFPLSMYDLPAFGNIPFDTIKEINRDFNLMTSQELYYQPWSQFSEPIFNSKYLNVNVDETGIPMRLNHDTINPDKYPISRVYVLGGSTTFGYNVGDDHTYPFYLSEILNEKTKASGLNLHVEVRNYGRGYFN